MGGGGGGGQSSNNVEVNFNSQDQRTDAGWINASTIAQAAGLAIAGVNTVAYLNIANKQYEIARDQLELAKELQRYWFAAYVPRESALLAETFNKPPYEPQYDKRAGEMVAAVRRAFQGARDQLNCIGRYCVGLTAHQAMLIAIGEGKAIGDAANYGYRYEENKADAKDAEQWSRKHTVTGLGRNLIASSVTAASAGAAMLNPLRNDAAAGVSGGLQLFGYNQARREMIAGQGQRLQQAGNNGVQTAGAGITTIANAAALYGQQQGQVISGLPQGNTIGTTVGVDDSAYLTPFHSNSQQSNDAAQSGGGM